MPVPEQVRRQSEKVQELYEQLNNEVSDETDAEETVENNDTEQVETQEVATEPSSNDTSRKDSDQTMEQRYRTLQGMYNAEVPRLHTQNKELSNRLQQMEQLISTLSKAQKPSESTQVEEQLVTNQDVSDYGEDSIDLMRRVSREEYRPVIGKIAELERAVQQLQSQLVPQVQQVVQQQTMSRDQQFWAGLEQAIPNWRDVNANPDFHTWLLEVDPLFGVQRQSILQQAQSNYDLDRVVKFFRTWMGDSYSDHGASTGKPKRASQLEKQVAPGRSRSGPTSPTSSDKRTYTPQDIEKFFTDVRKGKFKGREKERDRIERDIFAAQAEGRITIPS